MTTNVTVTSDSIQSSQSFDHTMGNTSFAKNFPISISRYLNAPKSDTTTNSYPDDQNEGFIPEDSAHIFTADSQFLSQTREELEQIFEDYLNCYSISVLSSDSDNEKVSKVLNEEGCPICLTGTSQEHFDACAVFSCKMTNCFHVFHTRCIYQNLYLFNSEDEQSQISLKNYHSLSFLIVQPYYDPELLGGEGLTSQCNQYRISLEVSHIISNIISMRIDWPEPVNSLIDPVSQKEFVLISLEKNEGYNEENEQLENLPMFGAKRGKILFSCTNVATGETFSHESNYDIYLEKEMFLFVLNDKSTRNTLTLGMKSERVTKTMTAFSLLFLKYEFSLHSQTPNINIHSMGSSLFENFEAAQPSPLFDSMPAFYSQEKLHTPVYPVPQNAIMYKIEPNSPIIDYLEKNREYVLNSKMQVGQFLDFTPISSPINTFPLPSLHSPSILSGQDALNMAEINSIYLNPTELFENSPPAFEPFASGDVANKGGEHNLKPNQASAFKNAMYDLQGQRNLKSVKNENLNAAEQHKGDRNKFRGTSKSVGKSSGKGNGWSSDEKSNEAISGLQKASDKESAEKEKGDKDSKNKKNENEGLRKEKTTTASALLYDISIGVPVNKPVTMIIKTLGKQIILLSKSQYGSRFIQDNMSNIEHFNMLFHYLKPHLADLMIDNFGHYAFEAMFSLASEKQKTELMEELACNVQFIACHKQGSFSLQSIMDSITSNKLVAMLGEMLCDNIFYISVSCSGHYVILRYLTKYKFPPSKFISESVSKDVMKYATDHYGLRIVKSLLDVSKGQEISEVYAAIIRHMHRLVEDQFGNYIVQHVLEVAPENIKQIVKQKMVGKYVVYSKQKFSSNVVEKCLRNSSKDWKYRIVRELINVPSDLINDKFGNYCLQTALSICDKELTIEFTNSIYPYLNRLRENVRNKWIKLIDSANEKHNSKSIRM